MPFKALIFVISFVLLLPGLGPKQSWSQTLEAGEALLSTSRFRPIPDGAKVMLQLADDSNINLRLRDVAAEALRRASYGVVTQGADYTLRLESERQVRGATFDRSIGSLRAGSSVGRPEGNSGGPRGDGVDVNLKLWSSTRNSLLSPKGTGAAPNQGFSVTMKAFDEAARKPAWHGIAQVPNTGGDSYRAANAMVRQLIDALGLTIEAETVSVR